jgi:hypothetical protein
MDPREDEVGNQFLMNMIANGNIEEEDAGDDDASNTNIYLNMSGDRIEQSDDGADKQTENVYKSNISFFYMYINETI